MAILGTITKQPSEILDFDISYVSMLTGRSDSIASATSAVTPGGLTVGAPSISTNVAKTIISTGSTGVTYKVTIVATTAAGLKYEDEVNVIVEEV